MLVEDWRKDGSESQNKLHGERTTKKSEATVRLEMQAGHLTTWLDDFRLFFFCRMMVWGNILIASSPLTYAPAARLLLLLPNAQNPRQLFLCVFGFFVCLFSPLEASSVTSFFFLNHKPDSSFLITFFCIFYRLCWYKLTSQIFSNFTECANNFFCTIVIHKCIIFKLSPCVNDKVAIMYLFWFIIYDHKYY